jgi:hypothetical protein
MFLALLNFLSYFYTHLFGASFRSVIHRRIYDSVTAKFFGKCTPDAINTIVGVIQTFIKMYRTGRPDALGKGNVIRGLVVLMQCLEVNLSNYDVRKQSQNETINPDSILDFLSSILNDSEFGFLHRLTAFVVVNSFPIFYETPSEKKSTVFVSLYERMPPDFLCFMIHAIHLTDQFAYALSSRDCRNVFSPILKRMELLQPLHPNQKEFISCFMRSLVLEMRRVYSESSLQLAPKPKFLSDTFMAFASVMSEAVVHCFDESTGAEKLSKNPLIAFYSKWLVLLEPFSGFSRASHEVTSYLHPLFSSMGRVVHDLHEPILSEGSTEFPLIYALYFELFSLYSDFIGSLLDGGVELRDATKYGWLIKATAESRLTPKEIDELVAELEGDSSANEKGRSLLRRGFSFQLSEGPMPSPSEIEGFIRLLAGPRNGCQDLMDFLYQKVNTPLRRNLTLADKRRERLLLAALIKQLGVSWEFYQISSKTASRETGIVVSHFVRQIMLAIYSIRRRTIEIRQTYDGLKAQAAQDQVPLMPSIEQDYPRFAQQLFKKAVFLLHIQPVLRLNTSEFDKGFAKILGQLQAFFQSLVSIEEYFKTMTAAGTTRQHISIGIALINAAIAQNQSPLCSACLIDRFATSSALPTFISSLGDDTNIELSQIKSLLSYVQSMVTREDPNIAGHSLLVFSANLILALAPIDRDAARNSAISVLAEARNSEALLAFVVSLILMLHRVDSDFMTPELTSLLTKELFSDQSKLIERLPLARMLVGAGVGCGISIVLSCFR